MERGDQYHEHDKSDCQFDSGGIANPPHRIDLTFRLGPARIHQVSPNQSGSFCEQSEPPSYGSDGIEEGHQGTQCGGSPPCHVAQCPLDCWRSIGGNSVVGFVTGLPAGPYAGKPPLHAAWELEERAQHKTGVDTLLHGVLPLGLANERG